MKSCLIFFLIVGGLALIVWLIVYFVKFIKSETAQNRGAVLDSLRRGENVFARFEYSPEEWKTAFEKEFLEDRRGTRLLGANTGITRNQDETAVETPGEVFFTAQKIYLTDSVNRKIYNVNTTGYGIGLLEAGLLNTAPLKMLRLRVYIQDSDLPDLEEIFHVPLPAAAEGKIQELLDFYQQTIEERGRFQRGE